jgi:hypothetical protein
LTVAPNKAGQRDDTVLTATAMSIASMSGFHQLRFHVPFDVDVRPHVYGSERWSVHSKHTAALSMQRCAALLTAVKFPEFFSARQSRPWLQLDEN